MKKETMALIIILVFGFSIIAEALLYVTPSVTNSQRNQEISSIIKKELTTEEKLSILKNGYVLIEYFYEENCTKCQEEIQTLEMFANQYRGYVILEEVQGNKTLKQMISPNGNIEDIENLTSEDLIKKLCEIGWKIPQECLLEKI